MSMSSCVFTIANASNETEWNGWITCSLKIKSGRIKWRYFHRIRSKRTFYGDFHWHSLALDLFLFCEIFGLDFAPLERCSNWSVFGVRCTIQLVRSLYHFIKWCDINTSLHSKSTIHVFVSVRLLKLRVTFLKCVCLFDLLFCLGVLAFFIWLVVSVSLSFSLSLCRSISFSLSFWLNGIGIVCCAEHSQNKHSPVLNVVHLSSYFFPSQKFRMQTNEWESKKDRHWLTPMVHPHLFYNVCRFTSFRA